jgi:hypothetical protein
MTNKFISVRKERDQYIKENKELQNEILILQSNIRQMIPGFSSNTSSSFPMSNELQNKLTEFFKCDCQDIFFDLLSPELNIEGIIFFFKNCFIKVQELINLYFEPLETLLKRTLSIDDLWSPIDNVLRKSYQSNWKKIFNQLTTEGSYHKIMTLIQTNLKLQDESSLANKIIIDFIKKSAEIVFFCHISDPPIIIDLSSIGLRVQFNTIKHESVDGFIKNKHESFIILPACYKSFINHNSNDNLLIKAQVLPFDYEFS